MQVPPVVQQFWFTGTHVWLQQVDVGASCSLLLTASLLQLRGAQLVEPPLQDAGGNVLLFNGARSARCSVLWSLSGHSGGDLLARGSGEVFGGLAVEEGQNDGAALLSALAAESPADGTLDGRVVTVLSMLRGPWALVYWQAAAGRLWFGRDAVGAPLSGPCVAAPCCAVAALPQSPSPASYGARPDIVGEQDGAACWSTIRVRHASALSSPLLRQQTLPTKAMTQERLGRCTCSACIDVCNPSLSHKLPSGRQH